MLNKNIDHLKLINFVYLKIICSVGKYGPSAARKM